MSNRMSMKAIQDLIIKQRDVDINHNAPNFLLFTVNFFLHIIGGLY